MRVFVGVIAYNEELFIEASLKSIYGYAEKIIVIDGSPKGPSTDQTRNIALSVGPKVIVVSGAFPNKRTQRQAYLNMMPKSTERNWCILHDADEVWRGDNIEKLINYMEAAEEKTMAFGYRPVNFYKDCWHVIKGGAWNQPRRVSTFRLLPGVKQINHDRVGLGSKGDWEFKNPPIRITLDDVRFHHYGYASPFKKILEKVQYYFERDGRIRTGTKYGPADWEKYRDEVFIPRWEKDEMLDPFWEDAKVVGKMNASGNGARIEECSEAHPEDIKSLIGTLWKKG